LELQTRDNLILTFIEKNAGVDISWTHDSSFVPAIRLIPLHGDTGYLYVINIKEIIGGTAYNAESQSEVGIVAGS